MYHLWVPTYGTTEALASYYLKDYEEALQATTRTLAFLTTSRYGSLYRGAPQAPFIIGSVSTLAGAQPLLYEQRQYCKRTSVHIYKRGSASSQFRCRVMSSAAFPSPLKSMFRTGYWFASPKSQYVLVSGVPSPFRSFQFA